MVGRNPGEFKESRRIRPMVAESRKRISLGIPENPAEGCRILENPFGGILENPPRSQNPGESFCRNPEESSKVAESWRILLQES